MFADPEREARFQEEGFAVVDLATPGEVDELLTSCRLQFAPTGAPMVFANVEPDRSAMRRLEQLAAPLWDRHISTLFPGHRVAFTTCVLKNPGPDSMMDAHEDGTFVDPRQGRSATLWMALTDCLPTDANGMIQVLPGSHLVAANAAGANVREWHRPYTRFLTEHLVPVPTRAGQAVVWDSRVLHGSPPNLSAAARFALVAELVPIGMPLVHVDALGRNRRQLFSVDDAFHREHSPIAVREQMPDYPVVRRFDEAPTSVEPATVAALCGTEVLPIPAQPRPNHDWFPLGVGAGPRLSVEPDPPLLAGAGDDWCEVAIVGLRRRLAAGRPFPSGPATTLAPVHTTPGWTSTDLAVDGRLTATGAELLGRSVPAVPSGALVSLMELAPGAALAIEAGEGGHDILLPLTTPGGSAGTSSSSGSAPLELGWPIVTDGSGPFQIWNDSGERVRLLAFRAPAQQAQPSQRRRRCRFGRRPG
jgi:hypothetical protein